MPVEIKELLIRAVAAEEKSSTGPTKQHGEVTDKQVIVEECVRQVLKILRTLKER
jgi:hypothetical protein